MSVGSSAPLIISAGEALIDLLASPTDNWWEIESFVPRIGGAPANASVAISRLGGQAGFLGCLADDPPGDWIRQRLSGEGVDLSKCVAVQNAQTRLAVVTGSVEQRDFVFYGSPPADSLLAPEHVDNAGIEEASAVIIGSLLLLSEPGRSALMRILEIATQKGTPLTFDPNPRRKYWPDPEIARQSMLPFIRSASILKLGVG
ncbi:MAG: PfkB family carbohydrate kinase, partial [Thermomicrobiaceae bacterium]